MKNIAVFYDIENIVGIKDFSLKKIIEQIKENNVGKIAIQKAYANWSTPCSVNLRNEIVILGIEPVQVFGFGKGVKKNASDIQLVIDAIDTLHTKPFIDTFVVVSGDGGFSALANKLHQSGKQVIGCSASNRASTVFESVCDIFINLDEISTPEPIHPPEWKNPFHNIFLNTYASKHAPIKIDGTNEALEEINQIITFYAEQPNTTLEFKGSGLETELLLEAIKYRIPTFDYKEMGTSTFPNFLAISLKNSKYRLVRNKDSGRHLVTPKTLTLEGFREVQLISGPARIIHKKQTTENNQTREIPQAETIQPEKDAAFSTATETTKTNTSSASEKAHRKGFFETLASQFFSWKSRNTQTANNSPNETLLQIDKISSDPNPTS